MSIRNWLFVIALLAGVGVGAPAAPADQAPTKTPAPQPPADAAAKPAAQDKPADAAKLAADARLAAEAKVAADAKVAAEAKVAADAKLAAQANACPPKRRLQDVRVVSVAAMSTRELSDGTPPKVSPEPVQPEVQLRQGISVTVRDLNTLLEYAQCANKNVVLFLDGRQMTDLTPNPPSVRLVVTLHF